MDKEPTPFSDDELSAEDRAVLDAFDAMDFSAEESATTASTPSIAPSLLNTDSVEQFSQDDMLLLFVNEVEEDLRILRQELQLLEPGETLDVARLNVLANSAHKIKGTAATYSSTRSSAMKDAATHSSTHLSTIARATETLVRIMAAGQLSPPVGLDILTRSINALEETLVGLVEMGEEPLSPWKELESEFAALDITIAEERINHHPAIDNALDEFLRHQDQDAAVRFSLNQLNQIEDEESRAITKPLQDLTVSTPFMRVDMARFEQLLLHADQLTDLSTLLVSAQQQVENAMRELQAAQARLTRLEALYSTLPLQTNTIKSAGGQGFSEDRPASSLIANILDEAEKRIGHPYQRKNTKRPRRSVASPPLYWDEMEIDRYTETDVLRSALSEAIADVATASTQLRVAVAQLDTIVRQHTASAQYVRDDTLSLRMTTLSKLSARIERAVTMNVTAQNGHLQFETQGETTEIDQDILEELKNPLLLLARTCLTNSAPTDTKDVGRVWFHAQGIGSEIAIELGFSMNVGGGALDEAQEALRGLHGSITARRNSAGGLSYHLRLPRSQGPVQALLVRVGSHHVIVPIAQVQRIEYETQPAVAAYTLASLLGFPIEATEAQQPSPTLILQHDTAHAAHPTHARVQVDEIVSTIEQVVKPLAPHLRRPGISGATVDGAGNVLLMVNLPELIRHAAQRQYALPDGQRDAARTSATQQQRTVLVADDSVFIRQSLLQTLTAAGYSAAGVRDGMLALEHLLDEPPQVLLLDVEMPNLNGFDLLTIIGAHPQLAAVRIIMLTSRASEKHRKRALELGAHAYLTKPCPQDTLLETIESLLM